MSKRQKSITVVVLLLLGGAVSFILFRLGWTLTNADVGSEVTLPIVVIAAVVALLLALTVTAVVFAMADLGDKSQALALPEGSVRAVIALSLVVIFATVSMCLYRGFATRAQGLHELTLEKKEEVQSFQAKASRTDAAIEILFLSPSDPNAVGPYKIYYVNRGDHEAADFAKQLFTLIGTLMTSVASFYFGARTATSSWGWSTSVVSPVITDVNPKPINAANPVQVTVLGNGLDLTRDIRLVQGTTKAVAGTIGQISSGAVISSFRLDETMVGSWEIVLTTGDGQSARFAVQVAKTLPV